MADLLKEIETNQGKMGRPIPGQSLSNDPENPAPFEKPPEFTTVNEGVEFLWGKFIQPEVYQNLIGAVADGTPIMNLVQVTLYHGFTEGKWNPDLMMMLAEPATYMIMALAERQDIPMTIYDGELEDAKDKNNKETGILTPKMEEELENLEEIETPQKSLMSRPETPAVNENSLMTKPVGEI